MKTNASITRKTYLYFLIGFLGLAVSSCGSYQNSAYNDNDGVYSSNGEKTTIKDNPNNTTAIQYKQYFSSLQNTSDSDEIFTDVNSYGSDYNVENDSTQTVSTGYASWGSAPESTTVVVYPDNYWYAGFGWGYPYYGYPYYGYGWGYPWYGYGWGYPGYGWGYPGYGYPGCGYPGYGYGYPHATPYAYNYSRRGSSYGGNYNNLNRVSHYSRNDVSSRYNINNRSSNITNRNSAVNRTTPTYTNRNSAVSSRNYTQNQSSRSNYTQQNRTSSPTYNTQRSNSNYTPSSNSTYRSSGSSMSSGGGARMSSGGGGGRMGGGGGRR